MSILNYVNILLFSDYQYLNAGIFRSMNAS
jgi:hypothetical protein